MKENWWVELVDEVIEEKLAAADAFIEDFIDPIGDIGSPAKVIDKPYDEWTPQDLQRLAQIYQQDPDTLSKYIASKEISKLYDLEQEVEE